MVLFYEIQIYLDISNVGEIFWFFQVVKFFVFYQLFDNFVSDLVFLFIDDWYVDVVNKYCYFFISRWIIGIVYFFVYIIFYCFLYYYTENF